ncbi:MAG TPA: hypothetical protein VFQ53_02085 [Kofleriaceae bacterium]|nr:hypothetical protein [Kofleriaceae bacterium]
MKKISIISGLLVAGLAFAGCSKKSSTPTTTPDPNKSVSNTDTGSGAAAGSGEGTPCAQEIAMVCGDGQIDACLKTPAEGDVHKCVAK